MIILASQSPRRKKLMGEDITHDFQIVISDVDEHVKGNPTPLEYVLEVAKRKGDKIHKQYPNDVVISADTIVTIDGKIIGKPKDENDAKNILRFLSDKTHQVITAFCIFNKDLFIEKYVISDVTFNYLDDDFISRYIASGIPMDKAGAYGIQNEEEFPVVKSYKGSLKNIIGFPSEEILDTLKKNKLI